MDIKKEKGVKDMVEKKQKFEVIEVPTQTGLAIKDNESGEVLDSMSVLVRIANKLDELQKGLTG